MDSVTQVLLGAAVGEAVAGKKVGNKAIMWGAICGTIPDLDVIGRYFLDTVEALDFHRGISHSLLFAIVVSPVLGYGISRLYSQASATWKDWTLLVFLGLFTHALLDCFTTWGTQLFWPVGDRVAFKSVFVIDPLYSLPLLVCLAWLIFLPRGSSKRKRLNNAGLILSSVYLMLTLVAKHQANQVFENSFDAQGMVVERYDSRPAPLNIVLWTVNAETREGYYIGYYSFLDIGQKIKYNFFPKSHYLLENYRENEKVKKLVEITEGWYTVEAADNGIIINDLRFGQSSGWQTGDGNFVFAYNVYQGDSKTRVDEVEKKLSDGSKMLMPLWNRIMGN
ncbi:metal-dependent hydrolase [Fulvivirga sp. 29W222]|uniref:Metal-dependent hydrolase n=1 Tax=Fulvivirga marina TaxID=2494733 RepID=A0A937FXX3_9BACT|nr:metal-dependent hydrolase [Fulvivirga marina]MBL6444956.1 metal-dependent hydrolase [Fulvivirga marina]